MRNSGNKVGFSFVAFLKLGNISQYIHPTNRPAAEIQHIVWFVIKIRDYNFAAIQLKIRFFAIKRYFERF